jgi:hypothetical protein
MLQFGQIAILWRSRCWRIMEGSKEVDCIMFLS